jgi:sugar/nucleoside kinase (ribokinase family)
LEQGNVDHRRVIRVPNYPTSTTAILLVKGDDRRFIHCFGANAAFTIDHIARDWIAGLKVFYLGGLLVMPGIKLAALAELLAFCRQKGVVTVVDVVVPRGYQGKDELKSLLPFVDYFTPNDDEAEQLTGRRDAMEQLRTLADWGAKTVIVTRGAAGAIAGRDGTCWTAEAHKLDNIVDQTGSGDAFCAGIVTGVVRGWDLDRTLPYAAALGASATRTVGTTDSVFRAAEAEKFVAANPIRVTVGRLSG